MKVGASLGPMQVEYAQRITLAQMMLSFVWILLYGRWPGITE